MMKKERVLLIVFVFWLVTIFVWQLDQNALIARWDTFFHASRLLEIREAFASFKIPAWVAFDTFHHTGVATIGMYPDFAIWPLVLLTNGLSFVHQVMAIRLLTVLISFGVATGVLLKRYPKLDLSIVTGLGIIYATSGYGLYALVTEFQPNTSLLYAVAPWIYSCLVDWIHEERFSRKITMKLALAFSLILGTHLLATVVILLAVLPFALWRLTKQGRLNFIVNGALGLGLALLISSPFLYRYWILSANDILMPFGVGNIQSQSIMRLIINMRGWASRVSVALPWVLLLLAGIWNARKNDVKTIVVNLLPLAWLAILTTSIMPWTLLNHVPIINTLQFAQWRFGPYLAVISLAIVATFLKSNRWTTWGVVFLAVGSLLITTKTMWDVQTASRGADVYVAKNENNIFPDTSDRLALITATDLKNDKIERTAVPD